MRRRKQASGGSLDSLLDTMTNVVGILVIVLVITQLGVRDAVKRIAASSSVRPETLAEARKEAAELRELLERLRWKRKLLAIQSDDTAAIRLEELLREIADYREDILALGKKREEKERQAKLDAQKRLEEVKKKLEEHEKKVEALLAEISERERELAKLQAQLAIAPEPGQLPAKNIYLPDPRPAPEGTKPVVVLCREGRLMVVDEEGIQSRAQKRAEYLVGRRRLDRNPKGIDGDQLTEEFNRNPMREEDFNLKLTVQGRIPKIILQRRPNAGETADQLKRSASRYLSQLRRIDPKKHYLRFLVWPDSFETYLVARQIASERGFLAGWEAMTMQGEYTINLGGTIRCGPEPPPAPPSKTPPKPAPSKPVPVDVID